MAAWNTRVQGVQAAHYWDIFTFFSGNDTQTYAGVVSTSNIRGYSYVAVRTPTGVAQWAKRGTVV